MGEGKLYEGGGWLGFLWAAPGRKHIFNKREAIVYR